MSRPRGNAAGAVRLLVAAGLIAGVLAAHEPTAAVQTAQTDTAPVRAIVDEYVGLYRKDSLARWRELFLPTFTATSANRDGSVTVRTLDEFYDAQARGFATATTMSETLEHVVVTRTGRLATAWADFVFHQNGTSRRGRLALTLIETDSRWKIAGLLFSY